MVRKYTDDFMMSVLNKYAGKSITVKQIAKEEKLNSKTLYNYIHRFMKQGIQIPVNIHRLNLKRTKV